MTPAALPRSLWPLALLVLIVALAPRTIGLADFYTIDEGYHWPGRVERFSQALGEQSWADTNQTGHPGVTTMWLGSLGRALAARLGVTDPGWAGGGATYLALLRLPLAVMNGLAAVAGFLLLTRLLSRAEALLAGLLWATSPFLVGLGRLLHLDGLLASFMALSVLLLLVAIRAPTAGSGWRWLALSGGMGGLALITKAPSLVLLPFLALVLAADGLLAVVTRAERGWGALRRAGLRAAIWLLCAALVAWLAWPAMWVGPLDALGSIVREIVDNGGQPHHSGNYFLGQPLGDPGPLFYPTVLLLRTTPWALVGLLIAVAGLMPALWRAARQRDYAIIQAQIVPLLLLAFVLGFGLALTLQAKKLDRYLLPIWPAVEILAAIGLVRAARWLVQLFESPWRVLQTGRPGDQELLADSASRSLLVSVSQPDTDVRNSVRASWAIQRARAGHVMHVAIVLAALGTLAAYHPYELAYYNPLLGGGPMAERVMLVGIGEGMDQAGVWLSARPDLQRGDVLSWIPPTLAPFIPKEVLVRDLRPEFARQPSSYAVLYVRSVQHQESPEAEALVRESPPLHTIQIHGVTYATIHQLPRPFAYPIGALFDDSILLRGVTAVRADGQLLVTPSWGILRERPGGMFVFVHVLDATGNRVAQVDAALDQGLFAAWQAGQQFDPTLPIVLPADLPTGTYRLALGVYDPAGGRLPVAGVDALPEDLAGPYAIDLGQIEIR
jgi:Dolichyl-phosphate-mannose-protein mannosyltransferase